MFTGRVKIIIASVLAAVVVLVGGRLWWVNNAQVVFGSLEKILIAEASDALGTKVALGQVETVSVNQAVMRDVAVFSGDGAVMAKVEEIRVNLSFFSFLQDLEPVGMVDEVLLKNPQLFLRQSADNRWNIEDIKLKKTESSADFTGRVVVENGSVVVTTPQGEWQAQKIAGKADCAQWPSTVINMAFSHQEGETEAESEVNGILDTETGSFTLTAKIPQVYLPNYQPLVPEDAPVAVRGGKLIDIELNLEKNSDKLSYKGEFKTDAVKAEIKEPDSGLAPVAIDNFKSWISFDNNKIYVLDSLLSVSSEQMSLSKLSTKGQISLNDDRQIVSAEFALNAAEGSYETFSFTDGRADLAYQDKALTIKDASGAALGGKIALSGDVQTETDQYSLNLSGSNLSLQEVAAQMGLAESEGTAEIFFASKGDFKNLKDAALDGTIKIGAGKVAGIPVKSFQGKIAGTGGLIEVQEAAVLLPGLGFANAFGTIENGNLNLTLEGEQIETALLPVAVLQEQQVSGTLSFHGTVGGKLTDPAAALSFTVSNLLAKGTAYGDAWGNLQAAKKEIIIDEAVIKDNTGSHFLTGSVALNTAAPELNLKVTTNGVRAETIAALAAPGLTGFLTQETTVSGPLDNLNAKGWLQLTEGSYDGYLIEEATSDYEYKDKTFYVDTLTIHSLGSKTTARGSLGPNGELDFSLQAREINLARMPFNYPYPVTGWINIAGQVSGNIADPVLTGKMNASRIRANGQILTGLTGSFNYQNAVATITDLSVAHGAGQVRFTGTANVKTTDLNGSLAAENVRIPGLLTLLKQPALDIDGYLNGTISVNGKFEKPALVLRGEIKGGRVKQYDLGTIALNASFINDVIRIRSLSAEQAGGFLTAQGHADLNGDIEMEINGENLNAGLFTALADSTFDPPGKVNFTAAASGPLKNPDANISLEIKNDLAENAAFDLIRGLFTLHDGVVKIDDLLIEKGIYKAVATGTLPLKALNVTGRKRADAADTMDISIKLDNADLSILPLLFPEITAASGDVAGYLDIKGTLAQPDVNGRINVAEGQGTVKLASLADPIEKIGVDIIFKNDTISIDKFDGEIRGGSYQLNGTAKVRGLGLSDYNLYFLANKLRVRHKYFDGALDAEFALTSTGRGGRPLLAGSVYTENSTIDVPGLPEERSGGFDIELDVDLNIGKKVRVYNPYLFDLLIDGKVNVGGTLERMMLLGHIESRKGSITYLSTRFNVVNATADFARHQGLVPNINLATRARAGRTFIMLDANGAADNLKIKLTSDPPMSDENIMKLLTLGYNASTAQTSSEAPASNFWLTGLQVQAAARVESLLRRNLGIDEFRVEPASMFEYRNRKATNHSHSEYYGYNLRVGKYLRDDLMVSYSTALDQASSSVIVQYDLNRRVSVSGTFGGLNSGLYTIEGRFRF